MSMRVTSYRVHFARCEECGCVSEKIASINVNNAKRELRAKGWKYLSEIEKTICPSCFEQFKQRKY